MRNRACAISRLGGALDTWVLGTLETVVIAGMGAGAAIAPPAIDGLGGEWAPAACGLLLAALVVRTYGPQPRLGATVRPLAGG